MARPRLLSIEQADELRAWALAARAESPHRGQGSTRGAIGRNATGVLVGMVAERFGVGISERSLQRILAELGLVYRHANQGGVWREAGR